MRAGVGVINVMPQHKVFPFIVSDTLCAVCNSIIAPDGLHKIYTQSVSRHGKPTRQGLLVSGI